MKKLLILSNVLLLAIIIYGSCKQNPEKDKPEPIVEPVIKGDSSCPGCANYSKDDFNGVPVKAAAMMANLYAANHYPQYTINGVMDDSRAVWFSLDSIEKFIFKIKQTMCKCSNKHELGLRMYYAEYPDLTNYNPPTADYFSTVNPQFGKRHTLFMVPTYSDGNFDYDFDPFHLGEGGCDRPSTICELFGSDSTFMGGNMMALCPNDSKGIKNHGNMCPPLCPENASCFPTVFPNEGLPQGKKK